MRIYGNELTITHTVLMFFIDELCVVECEYVIAVLLYFLHVYIYVCVCRCEGLKKLCEIFIEKSRRGSVNNIYRELVGLAVHEVWIEPYTKENVGTE